MKKYIREAGYTFRDQYDDMNDKQFILSNVSFTNSETSTLATIRLDRDETYQLFLRDFDSVLFKDKLEGIINSALSDGINVTLSNLADVENVENGYNITMTFYIQG